MKLQCFLCGIGPRASGAYTVILVNFVNPIKKVKASEVVSEITSANIYAGRLTAPPPTPGHPSDYFLVFFTEGQSRPRFCTILLQNNYVFSRQ